MLNSQAGWVPGHGRGNSRPTTVIQQCNGAVRPSPEYCQHVFVQLYTVARWNFCMGLSAVLGFLVVARHEKLFGLWLLFLHQQLS